MNIPWGRGAYLSNEYSTAFEHNIALPKWPPVPPVTQSLAELQHFFHEHERRLHIRYIHDYAPHLQSLLISAGLKEQAQRSVLVCTRPMLQAVGFDERVKISELDARSELREIAQNLSINARGYDPQAAPILEEAAKAFRSHLVQGRAYTMIFEGTAIGAGMFTVPRNGLAAITGVTVLEEWRDKGCGRMLLESIALAAYRHGCDAVFLIAEDQVTRAIAEQLGFSQHTQEIILTQP